MPRLRRDLGDYWIKDAQKRRRLSSQLLNLDEKFQEAPVFSATSRNQFASHVRF